MKSAEAARLRALLTACSRPHRSRSSRVSAEAQSRVGSSSRLFVGRTKSAVKGMTENIRSAAQNQAATRSITKSSSAGVSKRGLPGSQHRLVMPEVCDRAAGLSSEEGAHQASWAVNARMDE